MVLRVITEVMRSKQPVKANPQLKLVIQLWIGDGREISQKWWWKIISKYVLYYKVPALMSSTSLVRVL